MKKLYLLFLILLILFIPKTFAVTPYGLDQPVPELNGFTLREVFEKRNMAMPDLSSATDLGGGIYRLYDDNGLIIDYNANDGNYIYNGTLTSGFNIVLGYFNVPEQSNYVMKLYYVSGSVSSPDRPRISFTDRSNNLFIQGTYIDTLIRYMDISQQSFDTQPGTITYDNFTFKLQLEKGSQATPYQIPIDGPYSEVDVGEFNLTPEQIDMYYDYYLQAVEFENRGGMSMEFFLISIFFMYILIMIVGYVTKSKYFYFAGSLLWLVPIFNYQNIFIITTSIIVFLIHLLIIFYSDKDDVFE